jgi:hypothetical protein
MKQDGPIRMTSAINKRVQDGATLELLCDACEAVLCSWEGQFANRIFHPWNLDQTVRIPYGDWLLKFCVSVSWRCLHYIQRQAPINHLTTTQKDAFKVAERVWREFLLGERAHPVGFEQHFIPLDGIEGVNLPLALPPNMNRYLLRGAEMDLAAGKSTCFVYSKFGRFVILGFIVLTNREQWKGTKVHVRNGVVAPSDLSIPYQFLEYIVGRANRSWEAFSALSASQKQKIAEELARDPQKYLASGSYQAMEYDLAMFGDRAFAK